MRTQISVQGWLSPSGGWVNNNYGNPPCPEVPSTLPSASPSSEPSAARSAQLSSEPGSAPTRSPTHWPTHAPSHWPTHAPTMAPTNEVIVSSAFVLDSLDPETFNNDTAAQLVVQMSLVSTFPAVDSAEQVTNLHAVQHSDRRFGSSSSVSFDLVILL